MSVRSPRGYEPFDSKGYQYGRMGQQEGIARFCIRLDAEQYSYARVSRTPRDVWTRLCMGYLVFIHLYFMNHYHNGPGASGEAH
jgi:hypothetical protein